MGRLDILYGTTPESASEHRMSSHAKQPTTPGGGPRRPELPWIPAAMIGIGINVLAAGVIAFSVGLAIGTAIARGE
jgi:hypothetical protein